MTTEAGQNLHPTKQLVSWWGANCLVPLKAWPHLRHTCSFIKSHIPSSSLPPSHLPPPPSHSGKAWRLRIVQYISLTSLCCESAEMICFSLNCTWIDRETDRQMVKSCHCTTCTSFCHHDTSLSLPH